MNEGLSEKIDRRKIHWDRLTSFRSWVAVLSGTFFGSGLLPKMPGTWGTLAALPLAWMLAPYSIQMKLAVWLGLLLLGTWAGSVFYEIFGVADHQSIVIDEVIGLGLACLFLEQDFGWAWVAAFILFRFFDIAKLPPVRAVDRWSKGTPGTKMNAWISGFGVMADDLVAGLQALFVLHLLIRFT